MICKFKNRVAIIALTLIFVLFSFSCSSGDRSVGEKNILYITGSTSVASIVSKLAAAFERSNGEYTVLIDNLTSSIGIRDTINGHNDIGMTSRDLKDDEVQFLSTIVLCGDAISIIVNNGSEVDKITDKELFDLYENNIAYMDISKPVSREEGSGTRTSFSELTGIGSKEALPSTVEILDSIGKVKNAIFSDVNKLGYISLGSLDHTIKALEYSVDGQNYYAATVENVQNGTYPLYRSVNLVVKKDKELSKEAKAFLEFCKTDEAKLIMIDNGFIPL